MNNELLIKALDNIKLKNYKKAIKYLKEILRDDKENSCVWVLSGYCLAKLKDFEKAYYSFNRALKYDNSNSLAWSGKAHLLYLAKNYKKSLLYCDIALKNDSKNPEALMIKRKIKKIYSAKDKVIENVEDVKDKKIKIDDLLNSFNEENTIKKSGDNLIIEEDDTIKLNMKSLSEDDFKTVTDLNKFENIFNPERIKSIENHQLTVSEYEKILYNIKEEGKKNFRQIVKENNINLDELSVFKKILILGLSYASIEYKSKGAELGYYKFNIIHVDDRLDKSGQISTIIHELSHHILSKIFTQSLMYILNSDKTDAIEAISFYSILNTRYYRIMNEYCAHSVEGRYVPFGYQNYGSFNMLLKDVDMKKNKEKIDYYVILGNSFAEDITLIFEEFIPKQWRYEIKEEFKKDFNNKPDYKGILLETKKIFKPEEIVLNINKILIKGLFNIMINDDIELVRKFKKEYEKLESH
ncbi:MAG: hypothetical protein E7Z84_01595 [Methanosphaera stadtmanae]|nr:hypothetical protein [Methanosphaera stadtmanae]